MPKTLLLADDSVTIQKVVGISFANEDVQIVTVDNGDDALTRAREIRPDLVLADVVMPGLSGYEVCHAIKADSELADTPVLLLTGTFETFDEAQANEVGADGHITKPFEAQALVDQVNGLLASRATAGVSPVADEPDPLGLTGMVPAGDGGEAYDLFEDEVTAPSGVNEAPRPVPASPEPATAEPVESPPTTVLVGGEPLAPAAPAGDPLAESDLLAPAGDPITGSDRMDPAGDPIVRSDRMNPAGDPIVRSDRMNPAGDPIAGSDIMDPAGDPLAESDLLAPAGDASAESEPMSPAGDPLAESDLLAPTDDLLTAPAGEAEFLPPQPGASAGVDLLGAAGGGEAGIDLLDRSDEAGVDLLSGDGETGADLVAPAGAPVAEADVLASDPFGEPDFVEAGGRDFAEAGQPDRSSNLEIGEAPDLLAEDDGVQHGELAVDASLAEPVPAPGEGTLLLDDVVPETPVGQVAEAAEPFGLSDPNGATTLLDEPAAAAAPTMEPPLPDAPTVFEFGAPSAPEASPEPLAAADAGEPDPFEGPGGFDAAPAHATLDPESARDYDVSSSDLSRAGASEAPLALPTEPDWPADPETHAVTQTAPVEAPSDAAPPVLSPELERQVHDAVEKMAWDAFGDLSERLIKEAVERIERVAWEVIPKMAETLIQEEIRKLKGND